VPGETLNVGEVVFSFGPAAFITVAAVQQPAHWLIIPGWALINLGLLGSSVWRSSRVWLGVQGDQTRILSDDTQLDHAVLKLAGDAPIGRLRPTAARVAAALWLIWTIGLGVMAVQVYPRAASLEADGFSAMAWLAAWLLLTGSVLIQPRAVRIGLLALGLIAGAIAIGSRWVIVTA